MVYHEVLGDKNTNLMVYRNLLGRAELDTTGRRFKSLKSWAKESFDTLSDILWKDKQKRFADERPSDEVKTFYLSILTFATKYNKYVNDIKCMNKLSFTPAHGNTMRINE